MGLLPKEKRAAVTENPGFLILFGKPKCGKTTILSELEDCLILDFEEGARYVDALVTEIPDLKTLMAVRKELLDEKNKTGEFPYKYIAFDTATALEEMVLPLALKNYKATPMGKNFEGTDVRTLPQGGGYLYIREAYKKVIAAFKPLCECIILAGHTADKTINVQGKELSQNKLDLSGKLERIISSKADALGYVYRKKNQTFINFNGGNDSIVEARPKHLRGREIVIAESDEKGDITTFWDKIFI